MYSLGEPDVIPENIENWTNENMATLGCGGKLILEFTDNAILDVKGPDIFVFEVGTVGETKISISSP